VNLRKRVPRPGRSEREPAAFIRGRKSKDPALERAGPGRLHGDREQSFGHAPPATSAATL